MTRRKAGVEKARLGPLEHAKSPRFGLDHFTIVSGVRKVENTSASGRGDQGRAPPRPRQGITAAYNQVRYA
jgi:hypothetical protein